MGKENLSVDQEHLALLGNHAEARSKAYMLLSMFYSERPREGVVKRLKVPEFIHTLKGALSEENNGMNEGLKTLELFINSIKDLPETEVAENLAVDFTRLFRGIKRDYGPPPPYESVYRGEGRVMGEWTQEVLKKYRDAEIGMDISGELPDYIGIELKFIALLCYKEAEAWRDSAITRASKFLKQEQRFMDEHLQEWIPEFCNLIGEESRSSFYKGVALLTKEFLKVDRGQIGETLDFINGD